MKWKNFTTGQSRRVSPFMNSSHSLLLLVAGAMTKSNELLRKSWGSEKKSYLVAHLQEMKKPYDFLRLTVSQIQKCFNSRH